MVIINSTRTRIVNTQIPAYQVFSQPVFHMVEAALTNRVKRLNGRISLPLRVTMRSVYVVFTTAVACAMPFFSGARG